MRRLVARRTRPFARPFRLQGCFKVRLSSSVLTPTTCSARVPPFPCRSASGALSLSSPRRASPTRGAIRGVPRQGEIRSRGTYPGRLGCLCEARGCLPRHCRNGPGGEERGWKLTSMGNDSCVTSLFLSSSRRAVCLKLVSCWFVSRPPILRYGVDAIKDGGEIGRVVQQ